MFLLGETEIVGFGSMEMFMVRITESHEVMRDGNVSNIVVLLV
jgi:hypothetical protein